MSALFQVAVAALDEVRGWVFLSATTKITPDVAPDEITTITIDVVAHSDDASLLKPDGLVRLLYRGADGFWASPLNATFRLVHQAGDSITRPEITWSARSLFGEFDRAVLLQDPDFVPPIRDLGEFDQHYPRTWPSGSTVGDLLGAAVLEAKARGELASIDTSLVSLATDSAGNPWSVPLPAEEHPTFAPLSDLVASLTERGLVSVQFDGLKLMLLDPTHIGVDRSASVQLVPGRDLTEAPYRTKTETLANRAYVKGDNAICEIVTSPGADPNDIRAVGLDAAGITNPEILQQIGLLHLATENRRLTELTVGIDCWAARFVPWRDFDVDDIVTVAGARGGAATYKVRQITIEQDDKGVRASVVLGDRMPDPALLALKQLKSMRNGGIRSLGSRGLSAVPASSVRPGTPLAYDFGDGSSLRVGPEGFELKDANGDPILTNAGGGVGDGGGNVHAVFHGTDAGATRPTGAALVIWVGSAVPNEMSYADIHLDPSGGAL